ncbi:MAG TPA: UDP-N-acetylmuramoyl-L-alanyl-D-glutamate--2,6-diaminopimelate ligase [Candidatus Latescibacteria bacterium]|nr:UDP-N-acetylmuramoyl-L-alanyl-D-glutamate--2,6-diaminopimelate ligase [Candidatus Latescibacterota bacterium]
MTGAPWTAKAIADTVPGSLFFSGSAGDRPLTCIVTDSRTAREGALFCALPGTKVDGWRFAAHACERGASAVLAPVRIEGLAVPQIVVPDVRRALAVVASAWYGNADRNTALVGVTGTNGKTTTVRLVGSVGAAGGFVPSTIGTLGATLRGEDFPFDTAWNTTPEAHELRRLLKALNDAGSTLTAMEVSSHGLALDRVWGLSFRVAVFTNLTTDHLDFHGSLDEYFRAKARLFEDLAPSSTAVINIDDRHGQKLVGRTAAKVLTYGFSPSADIHPLEVADLPWIKGRVKLPQGTITLEMPLAGRFNVANAMAAIGTGLALGLAPEEIARGLKDATPAPGRFEPVQAGQDFAVIVDYAHTPDALENVLMAARSMTGNMGRVICVVGCGGDRDPFKRPVMGRIASEIADVCVFTSDNPRSEDPEAILDAISEGVPKGRTFERIESRKAAIRHAISVARRGDIVVIAGKGHEPYQEIQGVRYPFDDRLEARAALEELAGKTIKKP